MNFHVTLDALRAHIKAQKTRHDRKLAAIRLVVLERGLWRRKRPTAARIDLELVMELVNVEFALWALPVAEPESGTDWTADAVGRVVAAALGMEVFGRWLPEAETLTGGHVSRRVAEQLVVEAWKESRPITEWHAWLRGIEALFECVPERGFGANAMAMALFCAQSMVVPSEIRIPSSGRMERMGRRCAYAAYFDACRAWAVGHERYREASRMADLMAPMMRSAAPAQAALEELLDTLVGEADAAVAPVAERALRRCLRGAR